MGDHCLMALTNLQAVMEAIAAALNAANPDYRADPYPSDSISAPATVVGYPTTIEFDAVYQRGADRALIPIYYLVGTTSDRAASERISAVIAGAGTVKNAIDGNLGGAVMTSRVTDMKVLKVELAGGTFLAAVFTAEVYA